MKKNKHIQNSNKHQLNISNIVSCLEVGKEYYIRYIHKFKMLHQAGFLVSVLEEERFGCYEYIDKEKDNDGDFVYHFYSNERGFDIFLNERDVKKSFFGIFAL